MTNNITHSTGLKIDEERRRKTAGQIAYEAHGSWSVENKEASSKVTWETLDARAREYWDRIGAAVRAPLIAAIWTFVDRDRGRSGGEAYYDMLAAAGLPARSIRGLW